MPEERRENDSSELTKGHENDSNHSHEPADATHYKVLERRIVRKCDFYILPILTTIYLLGIVDRINIGNARIAGYDYKYLNSTPSEYNLAVAMYFVSYMIFEIPSNFVTKVLGFQVWMPIIMVCWAVASMSQAACKSALQLGITRFLLGLAEAGFPPSVVEYVGFFYARKELTLRYSVFMALITVSGALSGIISFFVVQINGFSLHGFQLLFLIGGIPTIILAVVVALFMTSGPADARFLTPEERKFALDRLRPEGGPAPVDRQTAKTQIKLAFQDLKVYAFLILLFLGSIPFNALNLFLPTLIKQLGFSSVDAQLMSVPPLLIATVWMTINSWASDRYETRAWSILASHSLSIIGLVGVMVTSPELYTFRYFCMVLLASGAYSVLPILFSWFACNIVGQYKRNITIGAILSLANAGGVIASVIYPEIDAPLFVNGNIVCLVSVLLQCLITIGLKVSLDIINKQRDLATLAAKNYKIDNELMKNKTKLSEVAKKLVENEPRFDEILCDNHPNWRYIT